MAEVAEPYKVWIPALRSGYYSQAQEVLFDGTGYCCFGVADVEVFGDKFTQCPAYVEGKVEYRDSEGHTGVLSDDRFRALNLMQKLTPREAKRTERLLAAKGSDAEQLIDKHVKRYVVLTTLNDWGYTFAEVADFIEWAGWHLKKRSGVYPPYRKPVPAIA